MPEPSSVLFTDSTEVITACRVKHVSEALRSLGVAAETSGFGFGGCGVQGLWESGVCGACLSGLDSASLRNQILKTSRTQFEVLQKFSLVNTVLLTRS